MKNGIRILLALLLLPAFASSAGAYSRTSPAPGYDPNNLISDSAFTAYGFSDTDTVAFLQRTGSWLKDYVIPSSESVFYQYKDSQGNCVQDSMDVPQIYNVNGNNEDFSGILAGKLIADQAHKYNINPQVILATLEKESNAVTRSTPKSDGNRAWVLGFGWNDKMASCGYDKAGAQNIAMSWGGVGQQIAYSVHFGFRKWFDDTAGHPSTFTVNWSYSDRTPLTINNADRATTALYVYTPYVYDGNYNFWNIMNNYPWFQTVPPLYAPPLAVGTDGTVYMIDNGGRWPVTGTGFSHWGFSWSNVQPITADQLALPVKTLITQLARDDVGTVYYMDGGYKRPISSGRIFSNWGFSWNDVSPVDTSILDKVPYGMPTYELVSSQTGDGTVYVATNGALYPISGDSFYSSWQLNIAEVAKVPSYVLSALYTSPLLGRYVRAANGDGTVYLVDRGIRYPISGAMASAYKMDLSTVRVVNPTFITNQTTNGGLLTNLVAQAGGDGTIYLVQNGAKSPITHNAWVSRGYSFNNVETVSPSFISLLPTGATLR